MKNGTILRKARHIRHNQQNEITQQIFTIISKNLILFLFKKLLVYNLGVLWGKEVKFCTFSFMWLQLKSKHLLSLGIMLSSEGENWVAVLQN